MNIKFFPNMQPAALLQAEFLSAPCEIFAAISEGKEIEITEGNAENWAIFCDDASQRTDDAETKRNLRAQAAMLRSAKFAAPKPKPNPLKAQADEILSLAHALSYRVESGDDDGAERILGMLRDATQEPINTEDF